MSNDYRGLARLLRGGSHGGRYEYASTCDLFITAEASPGNLAALGVMAVALIGLSLLLVFWPSDRYESIYPSLRDARKDGAIDRGWIPDFLPASSHDIHQLHDLSPSRSWCAFEFRPDDAPELRTNLQATEKVPETVRYIRNPRKRWWPVILTGDVDEKKIRSAGFELYLRIEPATQSTTKLWLFAIDWTKGRGYFYSTPG